MIAERSLLELLAGEMGCLYLSDLRALGGADRLRLARALEKIEPREEDLREWNDALAYLTGLPPMPTARQARAQLMERMRRDKTMVRDEGSGERRGKR